MCISTFLVYTSSRNPADDRRFDQLRLVDGSRNVEQLLNTALEWEYSNVVQSPNKVSQAALFGKTGALTIQGHI